MSAEEPEPLRRRDGGMTMAAPHILVVDDEKEIRNLVCEILEDEGYDVAVAEDGRSARRQREARRPDLILLDIWMPDVDGVTLLKEWTQSGLDCPVVMMSGHGTVETAVEATRLGAYDFIEKPLSLAKLLLTVERALDSRREQPERSGPAVRLAEPLEPVGRSAVMRELREQVRRIVAHDSPVLISGEPGSGKRCFARYLHASSVRAQQPLVEVITGGLSEEQIALELFGSDDGKVAGALERAGSGMLLIDDIMDLDLRTQARLQSALQRGELPRPGSSPLPVKARILALTRHDLAQEVAAGRFHEELYYQLNVVPIRVPPLREHVEDVPELLTHFVNRLVDRDGLPYRRFSLAAQNRLRNHNWPGNVRELHNLVQRLLIIGGDEEIGVEEVEEALGSPQLTGTAVETAELGNLSLSLDLPMREAREQFERVYLLYQLRKAGGSVGQLAKLTGMERTHLYRKLKSLGIDPKEAG